MAGFLGWLQAKVGLDNSDYKKKIKETEQQTTQSTEKMGQDWSRVAEAVQKYKTVYDPLSMTYKKVANETKSMGLGSIPTQANAAAKSFNGLNVQAQMLARELPALALSPQMFFLAISNNLPMLTDEIKKTSDANKLLIAEGKKGIPVWQSVAKAFLNWQTLLVVGITLLVAYGKEITAFVSEMFTGAKQMETSAEAMDRINKSIAEGGSGYGANALKLNKLSQEWKGLQNTAEKVQWIQENQKEFHALGLSIDGVSDADRDFVTGTEDVLDALKRRAQGAAAAQLAQEKYEELLLAEIDLDKMEAEGVKAGDKVRSAFLNSLIKGTGGDREGTFDFTPEEAYQSRLEEQQARVNALKVEAQQLLDLETDLMKGLKDTNEAYKEAGSTIENALNIKYDKIDTAPVEVEVDFAIDESTASLAGSLDFYNIAIADVQKSVNALIGAERELAKEQLTRLEIQKALASGDYTGGLNLQASSLEQLQFLWDNATEAQQRYLDKLLEVSQAGEVQGLRAQMMDVTGIINSAIANVAGSVGDFIGGGLKEEDLLEAFVTPLANAMQAFGSLLIAFGVAKTQLASGNPLTMIAAGAALVALGAALSAVASNVESGGSTTSAGSVDTFTGGYSNGTPTGVWDNNQPVTVEVVGRISGRDIVLASEKEKSYKNR